MAIRRFRKRPIPLEVIEITAENIEDIKKWSSADRPIDITITLGVKTLEGVLEGNHGGYLIKGVRGEVYVCEKEIFEETYELVDEDDISK